MCNKNNKISDLSYGNFAYGTIPYGSLPSSPNMTATNMTIDPIGTCIEPCAKTVTIEWTNIGNAQGVLTPAIIINGNRTALSENIIMNPGDMITRSFSISNLMRWFYTICPYPN